MNVVYNPVIGAKLYFTRHAHARWQERFVDEPRFKDYRMADLAIGAGHPAGEKHWQMYETAFRAAKHALRLAGVEVHPES